MKAADEWPSLNCTFFACTSFSVRIVACEYRNEWNLVPSGRFNCLKILAKFFVNVVSEGGLVRSVFALKIKPDSLHLILFSCNIFFIFSFHSLISDKYSSVTSKVRIPALVLGDPNLLPPFAIFNALFIDMVLFSKSISVHFKAATSPRRMPHSQQVLTMDWQHFSGQFFRGVPA